MPDPRPFDPERLVRVLGDHQVEYVMVGALAAVPAGTGGYADLHASAVPFDAFGERIEAAALEDVLRSKEASDRPQDRQDVAVLREMLRRREDG